MKKFLGDRRGSKAMKLLKVVVWIALVGVAIGLVMLLWNWLMPAVFPGVATIDYWQTLGLIVLSKVFFGGGHGRWKGRQRWDAMSMEERDQLKRQYKSRWGRNFCRQSEAESPDGDKA